MFIGNWRGSDESACTNRRHVGHACHASCFLLKQLMHEVLSHCFQFKYSHDPCMLELSNLQKMHVASSNRNAGNRRIQHDEKIGAALH